MGRTLRFSMWALSQLPLYIAAWCACMLPWAWAGTVNKNTPILAKDIASPVELDAREERLRTGAVEKRYHQTSVDACKAIMQSRFYVGKSGIAGGGIYWAEKASHTQWKAEKNGCLIEAWVALGKMDKLDYKADRSITPQKMLRAGYDSVWIPRGCRGPPCLPAPTPETVIYFSDQILQMTAAPCRKDGTKTGNYFPDQTGHAGPLSETPPAFDHSEGTDFLAIQYKSIGDVPDHSDLCPACPMCDVQAGDVDVLRDLEAPTMGSSNSNKRVWIPAIFGLGILCITVGAVFLLFGSGKSRRRETDNAEVLTPLQGAGSESDA